MSRSGCRCAPPDSCTTDPAARFALPSGADGEYWEFCVRFLRLYETCRLTGLDVTVKSLDAWPWQVPTSK